MASGTIKGSFTGTATSNVYPEIRWRSTSNVTANTSSVTAELWFIKVSSYWYPYNLSGYSCGININGNNASTTATIDMRSVNSQRIWSRTVTVAHNADGAKSITISSGGNTGLNLGSVSVSGTAKLDSIPRASDFGTITGNQIGSAVTIAISRASGSFTHDVSMKLGGATVSTTGAGTSASLTPALSTFCGQLPKATSGSATITLTTKNGSTVVGTKTKTITLYVPTSVVPSISSFSVSEGGSGVSSAGLGANTFVQNKSRLDMTAYAIGAHGSTIVDYTFSYNGSSQGGTVGRQFMAGDTNGTKEVKVVVTDSRGRKAERKFDVTVLAYVAPRINKFVVYRVDNSNVVKADISYTVTNINSKGGQWYIDKLLGSTWTLTNSGTMTTTYSANGITVVGTYDVGKSFSFRTNLHDAFGFGATSLANISTAKTLLDLDKDIGIGVGKIRERGVLDVGGDSYFSGNIFMSSSKTIQGGGGFWNGYLPPGDMKQSSYWHQTVFPKGYSLWGKTPDTGQIGNPNDDNGYALVTVFKENYAESEFTVMYYNQPNGRVFRLGGNYTNSRLSFYELYSQASPSINVGTMYEAGRRVHADWTPPELWTGATYMGANQTANPSKSLANCRNGWMLVWSDYTNGVANNYDWVFTPIPKTAISAGVNGMHAVVANSNAPNAPMLSKYIYIGTGTSIVGQANNTLAGLDNIVLRKVYEW